MTVLRCENQSDIDLRETRHDSEGALPTTIAYFPSYFPPARSFDVLPAVPSVGVHRVCIGTDQQSRPRQSSGLLQVDPTCAVASRPKRPARSQAARHHARQWRPERLNLPSAKGDLTGRMPSLGKRRQWPFSLVVVCRLELPGRNLSALRLRSHGFSRRRTFNRHGGSASKLFERHNALKSCLKQLF